MKKVLLFLFAMNGWTLFAQQDSCDTPRFPGGRKALNAFLKQNMKLETESTCQLSGTIYVRFTVDSTGQVTNPVIVKGLNTDFNNEALRVVTLMPLWIPAGCNKPKTASYLFPIRIHPQ